MVGNIQTKYNEKVKHHDKVVNKLGTKNSQKKMNMIEHPKRVVCKLNTKQPKKDNKINERHAKLIGQLHSQRLKQGIMTSTYNVNQVNKLMSQLKSTKSQLFKQKVARRQVVKEAESQKEKLESDINYLNR